MCDPLNGEFCQKQELAWKLKSLMTDKTTIDQNDVVYVRVQHIENLMKELECSI